jgi:hypothetical protein
MHLLVSPRAILERLPRLSPVREVELADQPDLLLPSSLGGEHKTGPHQVEPIRYNTSK